MSKFVSAFAHCVQCEGSTLFRTQFSKAIIKMAWHAIRLLIHNLLFFKITVEDDELMNARIETIFAGNSVCIY